jgi:hypothetical protein
VNVKVAVAVVVLAATIAGIGGIGLGDNSVTWEEQVPGYNGTETLVCKFTPTDENNGTLIINRYDQEGGLINTKTLSIRNYQGLGIYNTTNN